MGDVVRRRWPRGAKVDRSWFLYALRCQLLKCRLRYRLVRVGLVPAGDVLGNSLDRRAYYVVPRESVRIPPALTLVQLVDGSPGSTAWSSD